MDTHASARRRPININTATAEQLCADVKGIGPALAERIVAHREAHGPFRELAELVGVKGIGPRLLEQLAEQLTVEERTDLAETGAAGPEPWPEVSSAAQELNVLPEAGTAALVPPAVAPQTPPTEPAAAQEPPSEAAPAPAGPPQTPEKESPMPKPTQAAQTLPPPSSPGPVPAVPQRSFWSGLVLVLLGGLAGVLLTLAVFALLSGTLNFASRREVDALSRNVNIMQANQEVTWQRLDQLTLRLERLEGTVSRLERLEPQVAALAEEVNRTQADLERLGKDLAAFKGETQQALQGLDERLGQMQRDLASVRERLEAVEESLAIVQERVRAFDTFFAALRDLLIALEGAPQPTVAAPTPTRQPTLPAPTATPLAIPSPTATR